MENKCLSFKNLKRNMCAWNLGFIKEKRCSQNVSRLKLFLRKGNMEKGWDMPNYSRPAIRISGMMSPNELCFRAVFQLLMLEILSKLMEYSKSKSEDDLTRLRHYSSSVGSSWQNKQNSDDILRRALACLSKKPISFFWTRFKESLLKRV